MKSKENSLISIILPVYNGDKYLEQAINSCLEQKYKNFELIIINDASTDRSLHIAENFALKDDRIKIVNNKLNKQLPKCLNIGHVLAKGEFITWTSDDNILKPDFLFSLYKALIKNKCDIVFSNYDIIWANGKFKRTQYTGPVTKLIFGDVVGASFLYKPKVFNELKGYRHKFILVEDYDFFLRASLRFKLYHLEENLYQYRIHDTSLTGHINKQEDFKIKHEKALRQMFEEIGSVLNFKTSTSEFILKLYFNNPISIDEYLRDAKSIHNDILRFENSLKSEEDISSLYYLKEKVRNNWLLNKKEHTVKNLIKVFLNQKSLLGRNFNTNFTLKLFYLCLKFW